MRGVSDGLSPTDLMISVAFSIEGFVWKVIKCSMFNFGPNFGHNNPILSLATTFQVLFEFYSRGGAEVFAFPSQFV